ncbi:Transcription initiation factor IIB [Smittium culicis]|uniref:Transcription initiation factor IIB n=1 Tax=Smittium culicis TaxID=133412 RepID=A0A1R1YAI5_9FUNG|nr:Transcription initiation factor IIB [Smittium culicis]
MSNNSSFPSPFLNPNYSSSPKLKPKPKHNHSTIKNYPSSHIFNNNNSTNKMYNSSSTIHNNSSSHVFNNYNPTNKMYNNSSTFNINSSTINISSSTININSSTINTNSSTYSNYSNKNLSKRPLQTTASTYPSYYRTPSLYNTHTPLTSSHPLSSSNSNQPLAGNGFEPDMWKQESGCGPPPNFLNFNQPLPPYNHPPNFSQSQPQPHYNLYPHSFPSSYPNIHKNKKSKPSHNQLPQNDKSIKIVLEETPLLLPNAVGFYSRDLIGNYDSTIDSLGLAIPDNNYPFDNPFEPYPSSSSNFTHNSNLHIPFPHSSSSSSSSKKHMLPYPSFNKASISNLVSNYSPPVSPIPINTPNTSHPNVSSLTILSKVATEDFYLSSINPSKTSPSPSPIPTISHSLNARPSPHLYNPPPKSLSPSSLNTSSSSRLSAPISPNISILHTTNSQSKSTTPIQVPHNDSQPTHIDNTSTTIDSQSTQIDNTPTTIDSQPIQLDNTSTIIDSQPTQLDIKSTTIDSQPTHIDNTPTTIDSHSAHNDDRPTNPSTPDVISVNSKLLECDISSPDNLEPTSVDSIQNLPNTNTNNSLPLINVDLETNESSSNDPFDDIDEIDFKSLHIPEDFYYQAVDIYNKVKLNRNVQSRRPVRKRTSIIGAILFIICRNENYPRTFSEICNACKITKRDIGMYYKLMKQVLGPEMTKVASAKPEDFIKRWCSLLNLPPSTSTFSSSIYYKATDLDLVPGKCSIGVCAACIWLVVYSIREFKSLAQFNFDFSHDTQVNSNCIPSLPDPLPSHFVLPSHLSPESINKLDLAISQLIGPNNLDQINQLCFKSICRVACISFATLTAAFKLLLPNLSNLIPKEFISTSKI